MPARPFDLVIRGGTLVNAAETYPAAIGRILNGARVIDASGLLVLPGAIDPHVHLDMQQGQALSSDDFETGTRAAAQGYKHIIESALSA